MFPSTLSTFARPTTTDRLNNPSHSALHNTVSSAVGQIEAVIGTDASILGTIIGDLRNPNSNGGGHVQTANKGGTGQTSYAKGDLLVATSSSVISKLAAGQDGQTLVADSSVASGIKWGAAPGSKISVSASVISFIGSSNPTPDVSILSVTIPGSTLGTNNAIEATLSTVLNTFNNGASILTKMTYGGAIISSLLLRPTTNTVASFVGEIKATLIANNNVAAQRGTLLLTLFGQNAGNPGLGSVIALYNTNVSSVESSANKTLGITLTADPTTLIDINGHVVKKIL